MPRSNPPRTPPGRFSEGRQRRVIRGQVLTAFLAIILVAGFAFSWRYRLVWVVGDSMKPTFRTGDVLVVDKWVYRHEPPTRGDLVVARYHREFIVKRIVGLPGEQIEVHLGRVQVNGIRQAAYHDFEPGLLSIAPGRLLANRYAVLGDNRGIDPASFIHAVVSPEQLLGKVVWAVQR